MAKQLRVKTEYNFPLLKELQWVVGIGIAPMQSRRQRTGMFSLGGAVFLAGMILLGSFQLTIPAIVCFGIGGFFLAWGIFFYPLRAVTAARAMKLNSRKLVNEFIMEKENILVFLENQSVRYPYSRCERVLEAELALYVIMDEGQGLMMDKSAISGGSVDDLRAWLEEKCGATTEWVGRKQKTV